MDNNNPYTMRTLILSILLIAFFIQSAESRCSSSCRRRRRAKAASEKIRKEAARIADVTCFHDNDPYLAPPAPYSKYHFMPRCKVSIPRVYNPREALIRLAKTILTWIIIFAFLVNM